MIRLYSVRCSTCYSHLQISLESLASGEDYVTISMVIPYVLIIKKNLKDHIEKNGGLSCVATSMLNNIEDRFCHLFDPNHKDHQPIYAMASLLDVRYKCLIMNKEALLAATKKAIIAAVRKVDKDQHKEVVDADYLSSNSSQEDNQDEEQSLPSVHESPPLKRQHTLPTKYDRLLEVIQKDIERETQSSAKRHSLTGKLTMVLDEYLEHTVIHTR